MNNDRVLGSLLIFAALICGCRTQKIEKHLEEGVEVIVNRVAPYPVAGQPTSLRLEPSLTVDTETPEVAAAGLIDINSFQVDSRGFIYFLSHRGEDHFFFKFSSEGRFVKAFAPRGHAPGEMEFPLLPHMLSRDRLAVTDVLKKLVVFDPDGNVLSEKRIDPRFVIVNPLENGHTVVFWKAGAEDADAAHFIEKTSVFGPDGRETQELDALAISRKAKFLDPIFAWHINRNRIYHINEQRGYEIFVFDNEGSLLRKIQKEYEPVRMIPRIREALLEGMPEDSPLRDPAVDPGFLPPIHSLCTDEEGRIYAVTFEPGEKKDEYGCDIFTREGVFFRRISLPVQFSRAPFPIYMLVKKGRLYCVGQKQNGYQQLRVFRMSWRASE